MGKLYQFKYYNKVLREKEAKKVIKATTLEECNALFREAFENPTVSMLVYGNAKKKDIMTKTEFNQLFKN